MPPITADAADAFKSVRREKLIGFSLGGYCSCDDPMSPVIRILARLLQRPHPTATEGFGGSGLLGSSQCRNNARIAAQLAWFASNSPNYLIQLYIFIFHNIPYANLGLASRPAEAFRPTDLAPPNDVTNARQMPGSAILP